MARRTLPAYHSLYDRDRHDLIPAALLTACTQLHQESATILYGENHFVIYCDESTNRQPLFNLSRGTLRRFRSVEIVFARRQIKHCSPSDLAADRFRDWDELEIKKQFNRTCKRLSLSIRPNELILSLHLRGNLTQLTALLIPLEHLPTLAALRMKVTDGRVSPDENKVKQQKRHAQGRE